jgi:hypothetical protein
MTWSVEVIGATLRPPGLTVRRTAGEGVVVVPATVRAVATSGDGLRAELTVELLDGTPEFTDVRLVDGTGIRNDVMRALGLRPAVLVEIVRQSATNIRHSPGGPVLDRPEPQLTTDEVAAMLRRRRQRVPMDEVEEAVKEYRRAVAEGRPDPTLATALAIKRSRATAGRRLLMARKLGLMGPAVGTKGGEG